MLFPEIDTAGIDIQVEGEEFCFYTALLLLECYSKVPDQKKEAYDKIITEYHFAVEKISQACPVNFLSHYLMISAEIKRVNGELFEALELYDRAIFFR